MWPLKFDYLILARGELHEWVAIGVPNQNYLWIMTKKKIVEKDYIDSIVNIIANNGYRVDNLVYVPHQ
jgi:apolipoprotein D and lipocalin family protein